MIREEIVNMFDKKLNVDNADVEQNYSESKKLLDRIISEAEEYKKSLETKGLK